MKKTTSIRTIQDRYHQKKVQPAAPHNTQARSDYDRRQATHGVHGVQETHGAHNSRDGYPAKTPTSKPVSKGTVGTFDAEVNAYRSGKGLPTQVTRDDYIDDKRGRK